MPFAVLALVTPTLLLAAAAPSAAATPDPVWSAWLAWHDRDGDRVDDAAENAARSGAPVSVLVNYERRPQAADVERLVRDLGADPAVYVFTHIPAVAAKVPAANVERTGALDGVVAVEWDYPLVPFLEFSAPAIRARDFHSTGPNTVYNGRTAEALGYTGAGTVVAVLDTGVDELHEAFPPGKWLTGADVSTNVVASCVSPPDDNTHGTHVASTTLGDSPGGRFDGVARDARLVEIRIAVGGATATVAGVSVGSVNRGFDWVLRFNAAIDAGTPMCGATADDRIDVATLSFGSINRGGPNAGSTEGLVDALAASGVAVTIAVGNCGPSASTECQFSDVENGISSPGNAAGAIGVASSFDGNTVDRGDDTLSAFSSRGPNSGTGATGAADLLDRHRKPDVAAPGQSIFAALAGTALIYQAKSGTSMATPHVAGVAAILLQAGESVRAETGGVNLLAPRGSGFDAAGRYVPGQNPVRDALIHAAEVDRDGVTSAMLAKWEGPGADGLLWNNGWGYGQTDAFAAVCWAWAHVLQPGGARPSETVAAGCGLSLAPTVDAGGPYAALPGEPVLLTATASGGSPPYAFAWDLDDDGAFDDAFTASTPAAYAAEGVYAVHVRVTDAGGDTATDDATVVVSLRDVTPPGAVTGLTATAGLHRVALDWDDAPEPDVASYVVRRDGARVATVASSAHVDAGLVPDVERCYAVSAVDASGNEGPASAVACATPQAPPPVLHWPQFHREPSLSAAARETARHDVSSALLASVGIAGASSGAAWGNLDADPEPELVLGTNAANSVGMARLAAFDVVGGALVPKWDVPLPRDLASHTEAFVNVPALVESGDGDDAMEVVVSYNYVSSGGAVTLNDGNLALFDGADGALRTKVDVGVLSRRSHPSVGNLDDDAASEVAVGVLAPANAAGALRVFQASGGALTDQWTYATPVDHDVEGAPALVDLDLDGRLEVVAARYFSSTNGGVLVLDGATGALLVDAAVGAGVLGVAAADLDGDAAREIVAVGNGANNVHVLDTAAGRAGYARVASAAAGALWTTPSLGDVDGDGRADVVVARTSEALGDNVGDLRVYGYDGGALAQKAALQRGGVGDAADRRSPGGAALANLDGDAALEIVLGSMDGSVTTYSVVAGALVADRSFSPGGPVAAAPAVADVLPNREAEIVVASAGALALWGSANAPPALGAVADASVAEGATLTVALSATDADGDALALDVRPLPRGASFTDHGDGTGTFAWSPDFDQAGVYDLVASARDAHVADERAFRIVVANVNRAPVVDVPDLVEFGEGEALSFVVDAADPDGDALSLAATGLPAGATFDPSTGEFGWTPRFDQAGSYAVTFTASDGGLAASDTLRLVVRDVNRAPVVDPLGPFFIDSGTTLTFRLRAVDPDGQAVKLSIGRLLREAKFTDHGDGTGTFEWTPNWKESGEYSMQAFASDGEATGGQTFTIYVSDGRGKAKSAAPSEASVVLGRATAALDGAGGP